MELTDWIHFKVEPRGQNNLSNDRVLELYAPTASIESDSYDSAQGSRCNIAIDMDASESVVDEPMKKDFADLMLDACMKGDMHTFLELQENKNADFNIFDTRGFTPLMHAIKNGHEDLVRKIVENPRFNKDDCIHAAVESGNYNITKNLIELGISTNEPAKTEVFGEGSTPLVLACIINSTELIKLLMENKAEKLVMEADIHGATLYDCRKRIRYLKALSSPAYIALTSEDPVYTCFQLSKMAKWLADCELELADEYIEISEHCESLAAEFVNAVEDSFDIMTLLSLETTDDGVITLGPPLCRLKEALDGQHKKFVAHSHCQLALADEFIRGIKNWRHLESSTKMRLTIAMVLLTPVWAVLCIILPPTSPVTMYLKIPFVKLLANITIYVIVIAIIISEQITVKEPQKEVFQSYKFVHGSQLRWIEMICSTWLVGQIAEEIRAMYNMGPAKYFGNAWKLLDMLIVIVFSIAFVSRAMDIVGGPWPMEKNDRQKWEMFDCLLVYEATVCVGTLMAINRILSFFRAHLLLGKLQMSLGSSFGEIGKFMCLFVVMYLSFAAAINALYWKDQYTAAFSCGNETSGSYEEKCPLYLRKRYRQDEFQFQTISGCLYQLYWTLFGYSDVVFASKVYREWTLHTFTGSCLFVLFNFLAVVVLLNVLIGMITKVLDNIEDNIDVEWKFARSTIYAQFINDSYCLPPPFNIVPTVRHFLYIWAKLAKFCSKSNKWMHLAKPYKLENALRREKQQQKVRDIIQSMKDQYLRNEMKVAEKEEVTLEHVESLRNDVSGLKFEILQYVRNVPKTLSAMTDRQNEMLSDLNRVKRHQDIHQESLKDHSSQLDALHEMQMDKISMLDKNQSEQFQLVKVDNENRIREATALQTKQAQENTQQAKDRIVAAKEEQLRKVEMIYQKQEAYFSVLKTDQDNIMARQAIESQNYYQQFQNVLTKLKQHEDRFEVVTTQGQKLESELNKKYEEQMKYVTETYEAKLKSMQQYHERVINQQNEFIKTLLQDMQQKLVESAKAESEKIISSQRNLPSLFSENESAFSSTTSLNTSDLGKNHLSEVHKAGAIGRKGSAPPPGRDKLRLQNLDGVDPKTGRKRLMDKDGKPKWT